MVVGRLEIGLAILAELGEEITSAGAFAEELVAYLRCLRGRARTGIVRKA